MSEIAEYRRVAGEVRRALVNIRRCMISKVLTAQKPGEELVLNEFKAYFGSSGYSIDIPLDKETYVEIELYADVGFAFTIKLFKSNIYQRYLLSDIHFAYDFQSKLLVRDFPSLVYKILEIERYWARPHLGLSSDGD